MLGATYKVAVHIIFFGHGLHFIYTSIFLPVYKFSSAKFHLEDMHINPLKIEQHEQCC
jgi:hypothetical protein